MAPNRLLAALIVVSTIALAIGLSLEKSNRHVESSSETHVEASPAEGTPTGEATEAGGETRAPVSAPETHTESSPETVLGIDIESTGFVILAVVFSLVLAAAVWLRPEIGPLLIFVAVAMLAFVLLDLREVFHQSDESNTGLAVLAGVIGGLHAAAALLALKLVRDRGGRSVPA